MGNEKKLIISGYIKRNEWIDELVVVTIKIMQQWKTKLTKPLRTSPNESVKYNLI